MTLAACNDTLSSVSNKVEHPLPTKVVNRMKAYDMSEHSPIMMRVFKEENVLEVWKRRGTGSFELIAEYEICKWSGALGPKRAEGDRQAPEGFYTVARHQMNPNSSYYLSFNLGYPNRFDRAHGRTGSNLMVHGACSSAGCYSMSDENVLEIYAFAREAFRGGQEAFQVQAFPFRMTAENMARHRDDENYEFWKMLKVGYDHFELTKTPPKVDVCDRRYVFNQMPGDMDAVFNPVSECPETETPPALQMAYATYQSEYEEAFEKAIAKEERAESGQQGPLAALLPGKKASAAGTAVDTMASGDQTPAPAASAVIAPASVAADEAVVPEAPARQAGVVATQEPTQPQAVTPSPITVSAPVASDDKPFWNLWSRN